MNRTIRPFISLLSVFLLMTIGVSTASTVVVNDATSLVEKIPLLQDGDTLKLSAGTYTITPVLAPDGLILTSVDWSPYSDLTIIGDGLESTIIDFSNSYGFFAYYSENLLIKDLTIINAKKNGGVYVQSGHVNLESVKIENCNSVTFGSKTEAHGGAIFYDANSSFTSIKNCVFQSNYATYNGGAIAYMNVAKLYPQKSTIENCQFYNNTSLIGASAIYLKKIYSYVYLTKNVFFHNVNTPAIYVNATNSSNARLYLTSNSIALNTSGGLSIGTSLRTRLYLNKNAIVDNMPSDIIAPNASTKFTGDYNVVREVPSNRFIGYFNEDLESSGALFEVVNDSLRHTAFAANYLAGRIPAAVKDDYDLYADTCLSPADIGAINLIQEDKVAIWTGAKDQNFLDVENWRGGVLPVSADKVIVSTCDLTNYPIVEDTITLLNGGDFSQADVRITPTGIFENKGQISFDTLYVESQNGGDGQLVNSGILANVKRLAEFYFAASIWQPFYIPEIGRSASSLLPTLTYGTDYEVQMYNEGGAVLEDLAGVDIFDQNQGYMVKSQYDTKATFEVSDAVLNDFDIQHTLQEDTLSSGWNLIANPYNASVNSSQILANVGNDDVASGAVYTYDGVRYKVWVDGIGDEEASVIGSLQSFYVQALDVDKGAPVDNSTFSLSDDDLVLVENELIKSAEAEREGLLTVEIGTSSTYYDKTFIKFSGDASATFDYSFDAVKLDRLEGVASSLIYTNNNEGSGVNYAVNSQVLADDEVLSIPLRVDFVSSTISKTQYRKFRFLTSGGDSISYLLHDALKDSSESVEIVNNKAVAFYTGTDSIALANRFSIQVFDGEVPNRLVGVNERKSFSIVETITHKPDTLHYCDTATFNLRKDTIWGNSDTVIALEYMVDSFYTDYFFVNATYTDSLFYDTTFIDTTWLWGTHEYVVTDTLSSTLFKRYAEYADTIETSEVLFNNYIVYDTLIVAGLDDLASYNDDVKVFGGNQCIQIQSLDSRSLDVIVYSLSGLKLKQIHLPDGDGYVEVKGAAAYIVQTYMEGKVFSRKVIVN